MAVKTSRPPPGLTKRSPRNTPPIRSAWLRPLPSSASIAKAYLREMGIQPWLTARPDFPAEMLGYAMSAFYGAGRGSLRRTQHLSRSWTSPACIRRGDSRSRFRDSRQQHRRIDFECGQDQRHPEQHDMTLLVRLRGS
jgi:hypothetical protein